MDRKIVCEELKKKGIRIISFDFTEDGYHLEVKATEKCQGMEVLENISIRGFDVVKVNITGIHAKIRLIPNSDKEYESFIKDFKESYGLPEEYAISELRRIVNKCANVDNHAGVESFLRRRCK